MIGSWLRFFRVVNLPTVPGDVLVGAAAVLRFSAFNARTSTLCACIAAICLYLFGLADNDIVGAKTDIDRPIANGEISLFAARMARGLCLFGTLIVGALANLPSCWWIVAFALAVTIVVYNRTKWWLAMGLCRGLNVLCGAGAAMSAAVSEVRGKWTLFAIFLVWTLYIGFVTKYSEGEELDADRKRRVGFLIGGIVYLQLLALLWFRVTPLLVAGAFLLVFLRLMRRFLPKVSAS